MASFIRVKIQIHTSAVLLARVVMEKCTPDDHWDLAGGIIRVFSLGSGSVAQLCDWLTPGQEMKSLQCGPCIIKLVFNIS